MISIRVVRSRGPVHHQLGVFVGPDPEHRALAGGLTMRPDEADAFLQALAASAWATGWAILNEGENDVVLEVAT